MSDPITTTLITEAGKQALDTTKPWQKVFFDYIVLNYLGGKKILISNEKTRAEVENAYELKKLEGKITQQQIIQALQENDNQLDYSNLTGTLQKALPKIKENAEGNIDPDKIKRLKDLSKDFSSEEMQEIISGILAGEYNQSGSFSLKTMDIVRALSRDELNLFRKFCGLVINGEFIFGNFFWLQNQNLQLLHEKGILYSDYLYLQELGLFTGSKTSQKIGDNSGEVYNYNFIIANKIKTLRLKKEITLNNQSNLTKAGKELYKLIEPIFDEELFNICKDELINQGFE